MCTGTCGTNLNAAVKVKQLEFKCWLYHSSVLKWTSHQFQQNMTYIHHMHYLHKIGKVNKFKRRKRKRKEKISIRDPAKIDTTLLGTQNY